MGFQHEHGVALRFEKVVAFFLDGIPRPFLRVSSDAEHGATFEFSYFGFSPDYTGQTEPVYFPEFEESPSFNSVCSWRCTHSSFSSPSARIGSHYSPYVGSFMFDGKGLFVQHLSPNYERRAVRVPIETCEGAKCIPSSCDRDIRTSLLIDLYEKIMEELVSDEMDSMRRIVVLGTKGACALYRDVVEVVVLEIRKLFVRASAQAVYNYMCQNTLFRRIVSPLSLNVLPENRWTSSEVRMESSNTLFEGDSAFRLSLSSLKGSIRWGEGTHRFFKSLQEHWMDRFDRLVIFDTTTTSWRTDAEVFLTQLGCSMRAAFARIRIEFYTRVERLLLTNTRGPLLFMPLDSKAMKHSDLSQMLMATRIFLVSRIRSLILEALGDLVQFFTAGGKSVVPPSKARKAPLIEVHLTVGDCSLPRLHSFAQLRFGISDLLDELLITANNLPLPEVVIMRTLDFERCTLNSFDAEELSMKVVLLKALDAAGVMVEELAEKYTAFSYPPPVTGGYFTRTNEAVIQAHVSKLRNGIERISKVSSDVVFFGCIAINCTEVKRCYTEQWSRYMENYLSAIRNDLLLYLVSTVERCRCHSERLGKEPKTVEELEELGCFIKNAEYLSREVENNDCKQVIEWFHCLETLQIPVDIQLYESAMELMRCPGELVFVASEAIEMSIKSKPRILANLNEFRNDTRNQVTIIRDGVKELLSLFNLDVSDIAAQTCEELRVIVNRVTEAIDNIFSYERALGIENVDCFEDFFPLLGTFEVLEQFWGAIFDSTVIKDYYTVPVNSLAALKVIENVQQCRRLLHSSTRNLRAHPGLVRLGRQQEHVLANFESLESILRCITTPALRKNHWKEIARILDLQSNKNSTIDSNVTLKPLLDAGIHDHLDELKRVVDPAVLDFETEASLERMKSEAKRTPFLFCLIERAKGVFALSPTCRESINLQLESFLHDSGLLRQHTSLSQFVLNSIGEWEAAAEKMRGTLSNWKDVEQEWIEVLYFDMALESVEEGEAPAVGSREWKFLRGKIASITDVFNILSSTLQKPQYTLFTAMMQENIQDQLTLACTILGDIRKVVTSLLDSRREAFPRFWFLSDTEMISFLSVSDTSKLSKLLSKMYSRVCNVGLEGNTVVTFITADGATLKSEAPIPLLPVPVERWMKTFDKTIRFSLLREIQNCVESHYHIDPVMWLRDSCLQSIDVALRVIHDRDFRTALSISGTVGIKAYSTRLGDLTGEYIRLAGGDMERGYRDIVSSAITLLLYFRREVYLALKSGVHTVDDLDRTPMLQTLMDGDEIVVQTLGFRLPYGMEFLGNYDIPLLFPEYVEKGLSSILVSFAASSFPIILGKPERQSTIEYSAQYLGRFFFCIQCHPTLTLEGVVRGLRGALSVGVVFCLKDIDLLAMSLVQPITKLLRSVETACQSERILLADDVMKIEFEADETNIRVRKDPCFQAVFTMRQFNSIPNSLTLAFRPIYMPSLDLRVIAQGTLQARGYSQCMIVGQRLAAMYTLLMEVSPTVFTVKKFVYLIQNAAASGVGTLIEKFCTSFMRQFWETIQFNDRLKKLLAWNMVHTLSVPKDLWEDVVEEAKSLSTFDDVLERFFHLMEFNSNIILVGPAYSGKRKLWKRWVGSSHHSVISFRLISCAEIYGDACELGLLASLAKRWDPSTNHTIILENPNLLQASIVFEAPLYARSRPHSGPDFIKGPLTHVIAVSHLLDRANPRVMSEFAVFYLPKAANWKSFLKEQLQTSPCCHGDLVFTVIALLIDTILDSLLLLGGSTFLCESRLPVASLCSQLYKRWYVYAQSRCGCREEWISEEAFALQCAIFATCWSLGLRLEVDHRVVLRKALEKVHTKVRKIAKQLNLTEDVLPPFDCDILSFIATPLGWRRLDGSAGEVGFTATWVRKWDNLNIQHRAWSQFFPFPSREGTLTALEHLIGAGQPVLLVGGGDQGKSTILRHMQCNERWSHQMVYNNADCKASEIQEALLQNLSLRQSKIYGPFIGRKLVLCVDDVHLPGDEGFSQAIHLFSFIDRLSAICPPSLGYIPVTDVVCVGTSKPTLFFEKVEGILLRVQLPELNDGDMVDGVQKLLAAACASRRGADMLKELSAFIATAQAVALRLMPEELKHRQVSDDTNSIIGASRRTKDLVEESRCHSSFGFGRDGGFSLSYSHMFLRISERVLHLLCSPLNDLEVVRGIFDSVYSFYAVMLDRAEKEQLQTDLRTSAEMTLSRCSEIASVDFDNVSLDIAEERCDDTELPPCSGETVQEWIRNYETLLKPNGNEYSFNSDNTTSIIVSPPPVPKLKPVAMNLSGASEKEMPSRFSQVQHAIGWMSSLISGLHQCLRQEQSHVALIGSYTRDIRYTLRVWGAAVHIHVAFLRDNYDGPNAKEDFKMDLIEILQRTCRHDGRMVLFVPNGVVRLVWPLRRLDAILRGGDVTQLFTFDEQLFLLHGRRGIRRTSARLTSVEQTELRQRVCRRLSLVTHCLNYAEINRLGGEIPFLAFMLPLPLEQMVRELVDSFFYTESGSQNLLPIVPLINSANSLEIALQHSPDLVGRPFSQLLCDIFDVMREEVNIQVEQLLEFGYQAQQLRQFLGKLRRQSARSKRIAELPNTINEKMLEYKENIQKATEAKDASERKMQILNVCLQGWEKHATGLRKAIDKLLQETNNAEELITKEEGEVQANTTRVVTMLSVAAARLSSMKSSHIKQFATLPHSSKGLVLVKAACKIVGEELHAGSSRDMWEKGKELMTSSKFISRLLSVLPSRLEYESLAPLHGSLREIRYSDLSLFAGVVSEYLMAVMETARIVEEVRAMDLRLNEIRLNYLYIRIKVDALMKRLDVALKKINHTRSEVGLLEMRCGHLKEVIDDAKRRQDALLLLTDFVDRFSSFHLPENNAEKEVHTARGEGALIMFAAHHAFFAMLPVSQQKKCSSQLLALLSAWGIEAPCELDDPIFSLLFPSIADISDCALVSTLSFREKLCISALLQRVHLHWPFFGGASPMFERVVKQCLKFMVGDCIVVSALDPNFVKCLFDAVGNGTGFLVCDATVSFVLDVLHSLLPLSRIIQEKSTQKAKMYCSLFGETVEVKSTFFLVCVSPAVVPCDNTGFVASQFMNVINFYPSSTVEDNLQATLLLNPGVCDESQVNDIFGALKDDDVKVLSVFRDALHQVAVLLSENIDEITGNKDNKLDQLETLLGDLNTYHARIVHLSMEHRNVQRNLQNSWKHLAMGICCVERTLSVIEAKILGRHWNWGKLEPFLLSVTDLAQPYLQRISPNSFNALHCVQKEFYALVNFVERVVQVLGCSWPRELRGLFAWYVLSSVIDKCEIVSRMRGVLYSASTVTLNHEQYKVLNLLLDRGNSVVDQQFVLRACAASTDPLLRGVAEEDKTFFLNSLCTSPISEHQSVPDADVGREGEELVRNLFLRWAELDYTACELIASCLYGAFFFAVKDYNTERNDEILAIYEYLHPLSVHSIEERTRFCMNAGVPFILLARDLNCTLKDFEGHVKSWKLSYQIYNVCNASDLYQLTRKTAECFRNPPPDCNRAHCIVAIVVPSVDAPSEAVFIQSLSIELARYCRYGMWDLQRNGRLSHYPVLLCCVLLDSPRSRHSAYIRVLEENCFALTIETPLSLCFLPDLLQDRSLFMPWKRNDMTLFMNSSPLAERYSDKGGGGVSARERHQALATIKISNAIQLHAGIAIVHSIPSALFEHEGFDSIFTRLRATISSDDLALILRLMAIWVNCRNGGSRKQGRRSRGSLSRVGHVSSLRRLDHFSGQQLQQQHHQGSHDDSDDNHDEFINGVFSRVAYSIYTARMNTWGRLTVAELLRQRMFSQLEEGEKFTKASVAIEEVIRDEELVTQLLTDLGQSSNDFLNLSGDVPSVEAYRKEVDGILRNTIYGGCALPREVIWHDKESNVAQPVGEVPITSTTSETMDKPVSTHLSDIIQVIFLWEKNHGENLLLSLQEAGYAVTASRVRAAIEQLKRWVPGSTLSVWLPALRRPRLLLYAFAAKAVSGKVDNFNRVETVLLLLRRYNLLHDDIVLVRAAPSKPLEQEILSRTNWDASQLIWNKGPDAEESEEDILIAIRFRIRHEKGIEESLGDILWEFRSDGGRQEPRETPSETPAVVPLWKGIPTDIFPSVTEMQSACTLPVVSAVLPPPTACAMSKDNEEVEVEDEDEVEKGDNWALLFDLPLCVQLTGRDQRLNSDECPKWSAPGPGKFISVLQQPANVSEVNGVNVLCNSLSFFVTVS